MFTFLVYKHEQVLKMDDGDGCISVWMYLMPLNCILKKWLKWPWLIPGSSPLILKEFEKEEQTKPKSQKEANNKDKSGNKTKETTEKTCETILPNFREYYKPTVIKTSMVLAQKDTQINRTE